MIRLHHAWQQAVDVNVAAFSSCFFHIFGEAFSSWHLLILWNKLCRCQMNVFYASWRRHCGEHCKQEDMHIAVVLPRRPYLIWVYVGLGFNGSVSNRAIFRLEHYFRCPKRYDVLPTWSTQNVFRWSLQNIRCLYKLLRGPDPMVIKGRTIYEEIKTWTKVYYFVGQELIMEIILRIF